MYRQYEKNPNVPINIDISHYCSLFSIEITISKGGQFQRFGGRGVLTKHGYGPTLPPHLASPRSLLSPSPILAIANKRLSYLKIIRMAPQ